MQLNAILDDIAGQVKKVGFEKIDLGFYKKRDSKEPIKFLEERTFRRIRRLDEVLYTEKSHLNQGIDKGSRFGDNTKSKITQICGKMGDFEPIFDEHGACSSNGGFTNPYEIKGLWAGSSTSMGSPHPGLTPTIDSESKFPRSRFDDFESLRALRSEKDSLLIGFDTEFFGEPRKSLSWQFAVVWQGYLIEYVILADDEGEKSLSLEAVISKILGDLKFSSYRLEEYQSFKACVGFNAEGKEVWKTFASRDELVANSSVIHPLYKNDEGGYQAMSFTIDEGHEKKELDKYAPKSSRLWQWALAVYNFPEKHNVTVVCHTGKVDLTMLKTNTANAWLRKVSEVQGGTVSLQPSSLRVVSHTKSRYDGHYVYPVTLNFRDTMGQAPAGKKSLAALGEAINLPKLADEKIDKSRMNQVLIDEPVLFFEYASRDAVVTMLYASALYGYNKEMPVTLMAGATSAVAKMLMSYFDISDTEDFDRKFRGLEKVGKGMVKSPNGLGYLQESNKEPINEFARDVQSFASLSYHGGLNASSYIGYISKQTLDFDLRNAYPTAMCLVPDIDWEDPIHQEFRNDYLTINLWREAGFKGGFNPMKAFFGRVKFEFPANVKYPCIPQNVNGRLLSVRSFGYNEREDVVYCAGPEIYLALKLGAKVYCQRGFFLNVLYDENDKESRSLAHSVLKMVQERKVAKSMYGNKCLEELILKTMVNGEYGKLAQNVVDKRTWDSRSLEMVGLRESKITNPVAASLITSYVRATLYAAMNEAHEKLYTCYSVTTDGFIADIPDVETLEGFDLYGFRSSSRLARLFLTEGADGDMWEVKHQQKELLNLTTRGNMAPNVDGVNAHNSTKSPFPSGSISDREWFLHNALSREGSVAYNDKAWTTFKDLSKGAEFNVVDVVRRVSMDFDMKRKPVKESFETVFVDIDGRTYEIANFDTEAFDSIAEALLYESKKKLCDVLRTEKHWDLFFLKVELSNTGKQIRSKDGLEWSKLTSCVMGARMGLWTIDALNSADTTVQEKCDWLNSFKLCDKQFKTSDWKNARRRDRQVNALPVTMIDDFLQVLGAYDFKV